MSSPTKPAPRRALVLSGGGARGAYEAGVLRYLFEALPKELGHAPRIDIVTGTSVGAVHACYVAATAHLERSRSARLGKVWEQLQGDVVLGSPTRELTRLPRRLLGALRAPRELASGELPARLYGLIDTQRLEELVTQGIPWNRISRNLSEGRLEALSVAATEVATGRTVVFVETADIESEPRWTLDPSVVARPTHIRLDHALASAAIPVLFPTVRIDDSYFADGGLRLNTPLSPALRLGADRILVIALRGGATGGRAGDAEARRVERFGNPLFLFGKVLNALLLDHVESDLSHMRLLNDILRRVRDAGGGEALRAVNTTVERERGQPFKIVDDLVVRPSRDLGHLAGEIAHASREARSTSGPIRMLLGVLGLEGSALEADLLSYLYFDAAYTVPLMELGYADAAGMREELVGFFGG